MPGRGHAPVTCSGNPRSRYEVQQVQRGSKSKVQWSNAQYRVLGIGPRDSFGTGHPPISSAGSAMSRDPEKHREAQRRYREANREKRRESQRRYCEAHPERQRESERRYREARPERVAETQRKRLARLKAAVFGHYGDQCVCCGTTDRPTIDHINGDGRAHRKELYGHRPSFEESRTTGPEFYAWLIRNGFPDGYQTLCLPCNASKGDGARCRLQHLAQ
jgi:hypothetical protein